MQEPIVKRALGKDWDLVPEILQRNFSPRPGSECEIRLKGLMYDISHSRIGRLLIYPGRLFGALVPYQGNNIGIRIDLRTHESDPRFMYWHRVHFFPENPELVFSSRMEYLGGNEFIERVRTSLGMRMKASINAGVLKFEAVCYQWDLFGFQIRLPNWLLLGTGVILERQVAPDQFEMRFEINHPWWGRTFTYTGIFSIV
ncbi:MAG: hypothetical protein RLZZ227_1295 [Pseudomonadota bacterium]